MSNIEKLTWSDDLITNSENIDNQHKAIFKIINEFISLQNTDPNPFRSAEMLSELNRYGKQHIMEEEEYMKQHSYPKLKEHAMAHKEYLKKVELLHKHLLDNNDVCYAKIIDFVKGWWFVHINSMDLDYVNYIKSKQNIEIE